MQLQIGSWQFGFFKYRGASGYSLVCCAIGLQFFSFIAFDNRIIFICWVCFCNSSVSIVAITAAEELSDENMIGLCRRRIAAFTSGFSPFRSGEHEGIIIPSVLTSIITRFRSDTVVGSFFHLSRHIFSCEITSTDSTGNIITTIDCTNLDITADMLTINVDEGAVSNICLAGATINTTLDVASIYGNIGISVCITNITTTVDIATNRDLRIDIEH